MTDINSIASKSLGDSTSYAVFTDKFDPSLLNPMPRHLAREGWGIKGTEFLGVDVWHCHESTFLLDNGLPVAGTLKFMYAADSEFMIESKSMKLYLNSFDMCKMGPTVHQASSNYENQIREDLERVLNTKVQLNFFDSTEYYPQTEVLEEYSNPYATHSSSLAAAEFTDYTGQANHLQVVESELFETQRLQINTLRSRCSHTKQKDTGAAFIDVESDAFCVTPVSVVKQIASLREVNEFHEFCAEKLLVEFASALGNNGEACVALMYSRRGSLDINPVRWTRGFQDFSNAVEGLMSPLVLIEKAQGQ